MIDVGHPGLGPVGMVRGPWRHKSSQVIIHQAQGYHSCAPGAGTKSVANAPLAVLTVTIIRTKIPKLNVNRTVICV